MKLPRLRHHSHLCPSPQPISSLSVSPFLPPQTSLQWTLVIGSMTHSDNPGLSPPFNNLNTSAKTSFPNKVTLRDFRDAWGHSNTMGIRSVQSLSHIRLFATLWTAAHQASLSITNSQGLSKLMSIESVMPSNCLILCRPLLLLPSIFPCIRVFSSESALHIRWLKY